MKFDATLTRYSALGAALALLAASPVVAFDPEHVETFKRLDGDCESCDLTGADLQGLQKVGGGSGSDSDFSGANLSDATLTNVLLSRANLTGANLSRIDSLNVDFYGANLTDADLSGARLRFANFGNANLTRANLRGASIDVDAQTVGAVFCNTIMPDGSVRDDNC